MLFNFNDRKKDKLYDMARELIGAGANESDPVQIQDLRTKWIGNLTLRDMGRYRFGESRKGIRMRKTQSKEVMDLVNESRGECKEPRRKRERERFRGGEGDDIEEAKRWEDDDDDTPQEFKRFMAKSGRRDKKKSLPKMRDKDECMNKGNKEGVPTVFKKEKKDALGSKATSVARKQSKKV